MVRISFRRIPSWFICTALVLISPRGKDRGRELNPYPSAYTLCSVPPYGSRIVIGVQIVMRTRIQRGSYLSGVRRPTRARAHARDGGKVGRRTSPDTLPSSGDCAPLHGGRFCGHGILHTFTPAPGYGLPAASRAYARRPSSRPRLPARMRAPGTTRLAPG